MKQMKKKKIRIATHNKPVKSHVVVRVPIQAPSMAILNYRGSRAIVMFLMPEGYRDDTNWYTKMDVSTINNEYGTNFDLNENWWGLSTKITEDLKTEMLYKSAISALKALKREFK